MVRYRPSHCFSNYSDDALVFRSISSAHELYPLHFTRTQLIEYFGSKYKMEQLPADFAGARSEGIAEVGNYLVIGEYAENSARILCLTNKSLCVEEYYQKISGVRHIHSVCNGISENTIFVSTGDGNKYLDEWKIGFSELVFFSRIKNKLAGYTASVEVKGIKYFGTDFSSRPNYLETLDGEKYFFPLPAYFMYVEALTSIDERYIVSLNKEHSPVGWQRSLSIFDTNVKKYIYCAYYQPK